MGGAWLTAGLASRGRRLLAAATAAVIGVAFLTAGLALLGTVQRGIEDAVAGGVRDADLVVTATSLDTAAHDAVAGLAEVADVRGEAYVGAERSPERWVSGSTVPADVTVVEGRLPTAAGEVIVGGELAEHAGLGERLTLTPAGGTSGAGAADGDDAAAPVTLTVVGVADFGELDPVLSYGETFAATDATLRTLDPDLAYRSAAVDLAPGADPADARAAIAAAVPGATVVTGPEAAAERVAALTGETDVVAAIVLGFVGVALATAAIVIANTFTITLAQRTRELALLRAVGATTAQVRARVLLEAAALGLLSGVVGVGAGILAGTVLLAVGRGLDLGLPLPATLAVTPAVVLVPLVVGAAVTVLAGLWPALRATRVPPLAAMRPRTAAGADGRTRRSTRRRATTALLLVVAGVAAMVHAATARDVLTGVLGGTVSFAGVLVGLVLVVPAAVRALGAPLRGVPGRLAVDNAVRDPGRAAATGAALLVGVTLLTMASAGASSGESTALREIDETYAIDLVVSTGGQHAEDDTERVDALPLPAEARARLAGIEGVNAARTVDGAYLTLGDADVPTAAIGLDPGRDGDVVRGAEQLAGLVPGALGMSDSMRALHGLAPGDTVEVTGPGGSAELAVVPFAAGYTVVLHMSDLGSLGGDAVAAGTALLRLADDADLRPVVAAVSDLADEAGLQLEGSAAERGRVVQVLDMLVLVTTALLGVALVIAVVGIANTLALSVVERRHEHALLRALGLTRGQVRSVLVTEAVLLALAGTVLGLVLGLVYAALGVQTVLPTGVDLRPDVPWGRLAVVVGVAVVAGTLAGLVPARRAARVSPVEGMAAV